jgi:hypothetical protein
MGIDFTVDSAILRVRRKLQLRASNDKLTTDELVQIMDEDIQVRLFPALMECVEDYAVEWAMVTVVAGYFQARLPALATANTVQSVRYVRPSDGREVEMRRVPLSELPTRNVAANQLAMQPPIYALDNANICVFPQPTENAQLRVLYQRRPSRLVQTSACTAAIAQTTYGTIEVASTAGFVANQSLDAVPGSPPLGIWESYLYVSQILAGPARFVLLSSDPTTGTTPHNLTGFAFTSPAGVSTYGQSNDWLCPIGFTCVFPLPDAWYPLWITSSAAQAAFEQGDVEVSAALRAEADKLMAELQVHAGNRARSQPIPMFNHYSPLRLSRRVAGGTYGGYP